MSPWRTPATPAAAAATAASALARLLRGRAPGAPGCDWRREDRLVVVVLVVEDLGAARGEIAAQRLVARHRRVAIARLVVLAVVLVLGRRLRLGAPHGGLDLERVDLDAGAVLAVGVLRLFLRDLGRRGRRGAALALLAVPLAEREDARLHLDDRVVLVVLLEGRREPGAHRDLGRLAHVREEVLLDRELRDLLVVERLAGEAENLRGGFGERHVLLSVRPLFGAPLCRERSRARALMAAPDAQFAFPDAPTPALRCPTMGAASHTSRVCRLTYPGSAPPSMQGETCRFLYCSRLLRAAAPRPGGLGRHWRAEARPQARPRWTASTARAAP